MEATELYTANTKTVVQLLGESGVHFYIPAYQRPYAWERSNVEKLFADITYGLKNAMGDPSSFAFIGTIITIKDTKNETIHPLYKGQLPAQVRLVIDGQQRLTTLSMMLLILHNRLRTTYRQKTQEIEKLKEPAQKWIRSKLTVCLASIARTLHEERHNPPKESAWYPKIIRAYQDAWTVDSVVSPYTSPLARTVADYQDAGGFDLSAQAAEFVRPGTDEETSQKFRKRYTDIVNMLKQSIRDGAVDSEDESRLPSASMMLFSDMLQRYLQTTDEEVADLFPDETSLAPVGDLVRLLGLAHYLLNSVALTSVIVSKDEDAFAVFDSLNTTGKPLTPYETLRPLVMRAVTLAAFDKSEEKKVLDRIDALLGDNETKKFDTRCEHVAVDFALLENGRKLSRRHDEQRLQYKKTFSRVEAEKEQRLDYLNSLEIVTSLRIQTFERWNSVVLPHGLEQQLTSEALLCLSFLVKFDHSITIPLISRFVARVVGCPAVGGERESALADLDAVIKGVTSFSCLYRSTRRGTSGIDDVYRDLMNGGAKSPTSMLPLHRSPFKPGGECSALAPVEAKPVLEDLRRRLTDTNLGEISNRSVYIAKASELPLYEISQPLTRFLLLVAQHNSAMDAENPGLLKPALPGLFECLDIAQWMSEDTNSVEHVAPQKIGAGWPDDVRKDELIRQTLGNLTLCPKAANSSLGNRPWDEKRLIFRALSSETKDQARPLIEQIVQKKSDRDELLSSLRHIPYLTSIGSRVGEWDRDFIVERSRCLYGRVWDALYPWLSSAG